MLRGLGISLLMMGLLAAGIDGFRQRERVRSGGAINQADQVHTSDANILPPN